jgi:hypothetical protein
MNDVSAQVASARFSSETDFCFFAIPMAAANEASIDVILYRLRKLARRLRS